MRHHKVQRMRRQGRYLPRKGPWPTDRGPPLVNSDTSHLGLGPSWELVDRDSGMTSRLASQPGSRISHPRPSLTRCNKIRHSSWQNSLKQKEKTSEYRFILINSRMLCERAECFTVTSRSRCVVHQFKCPVASGELLQVTYLVRCRF